MKRQWRRKKAEGRGSFVRQTYPIFVEIANDRWKERKKATVAHDHGYILQEAPAPSNEVVIDNDETHFNTPFCKVNATVV